MQRSFFFALLPGRRSILLSATMLMGNMVSPITAFAGETGTEGNEAYEAPVGEAGAEQPVTEAP